QRRAQLDDALRVVRGARGVEAVARGHVDVAVAVEAHPRRRPDAAAVVLWRALVRVQHAAVLVDGDDEAVVVAAVAREPAEGHVHAAPADRERAALLLA